MVNRLVLTHVLEAIGAYKHLGYPFIFHNRWATKATIEIFDNNGVNWGGYNLLIVFPEQYPFDLPKLFELDGRIKFEACWHRNSDLSCCIGPWVTEMMKYNGKVNFLEWLNHSAFPYLANHFHKERFGIYANGEYSHDFLGILEMYRELWGLSLVGTIQRLELITYSAQQSAGVKCFCGSGRVYRKCHDGNLTYNGIPRLKFKDSLRMLKWYEANKRA